MSRGRAAGTLALLGAAAMATHGCAEPPRVVVPAPVQTASEAKPAASAAPPFTPLKITLEQAAMGTKVVVVAYTTPEVDEAATKRAMAQSFREVQRLERIMSTWVETSEVSMINAAAGRSAVAVGPETFAVIEKSLWIGRESKGVFDISFDAMRGLWKFDEGVDGSVPVLKSIRAAQKLIDYRRIEVDPAASTVKLGVEGMRINLGGIAKGYAVDAAARVLDEAKLRGFFVQAGGDLFARGRKPDGSRFRVGVRDPRGRGPEDYFAMLELEDHAFSTAGDYERSFVKDGKRYHHIIDPRTGYPATKSRSVTVWARDAFTADAIDDAAFILGPEEGLALVEAQPDVGAVIVDGEGRVHVSRRLEGVVRVHRQPTEGI